MGGGRSRSPRYGTTTGRRRRCGWLDLALVKYSAMVKLGRRGGFWVWAFGEDVFFDFLVFFVMFFVLFGRCCNVLLVWLYLNGFNCKEYVWYLGDVRRVEVGYAWECCLEGCFLRLGWGLRPNNVFLALGTSILFTH